MVASTAQTLLLAAALTATTITASATAQQQQQQQPSSSSAQLRATAATTTSNNDGGGDHAFVQFPRNLQDIAPFDFFDPNEDLCDNGPDPLNDRPQLGPCDFSRFPVCGGRNEEQICYNRKPSRDHFHSNNHQHKFYIQYDRVFCYPEYWGGCSSCTPGRYCVSEKRCILDEVDYPCAQWF